MAKVALITGAGSGIGGATAIALAQAGFRVVLAGRRRDPLEETRRLIGAGEPILLTLDVTDPHAVERAYADLARQTGRLDLLFNNAGIDVPNVSFDELAFADWSRVLATNLTGQFLCAQGAFRLMKAQRPQGGRIINNGSIAAHAPRPNSAPYAASKHGVSGLTKALMIDGRPFGIAVSQIDIGNATADPEKPRPPSIQPSGEVKVEPFMGFDSVAAAIVFMASLPVGANAPFVTVMATNMPFVGHG